MATIEHNTQKQLWEEEHLNPNILHQMDSYKPSGGVLIFIDWLKERGLDITKLKGIELGCGKGRNVIGLARMGVETTGLDFSSAAIEQAKQRAADMPNAYFLIHDATETWPLLSENFDFALDCFTTTDIESPEGRKFAANETVRVLKPEGQLLVYTLSSRDTWSQERLSISPLDEKNTYTNPAGKFEKCFDTDELMELYAPLMLVKHRRVKKTPEYEGKSYPARHHWMVFEKVK